VYGFRPDGSTVSRPTGIAGSKSLALDAQGNLVVTAGGTTLARVAPTGAVTILASNGLSGPVDAVADGSTLLVSNYLDNTVSRVSADGAITPAYSGLLRPQGLARDAQGNLYVANSGTNSIVRIDASGTSSTYATGIPNPYFLDLTSAGDLLATSGHTIYRVAQGGEVSAFARGGVQTPRALLYEPDGSLLVGNGSGVLARIGHDSEVSHLTTALSDPRDMERGPDGAVYVANWRNGSIGRFVDGTYSAYLSGFTTPSGLAFDETGALYVAEATANRVARVDASGTRSTLIQSFISNPRQPLVRADGTLFVVNSSSAAVVEPGQTGRVMASGLGSVTSATMTADGTVYVLLNSTYIEHIDDSGARTRLATISGLVQIAGGEAGELFYADSSRRIARLDLSTGESETLATVPSTVNGLARASDGTLYVAAGGRVYRVADGAATQLLQYSSTGTIATDAANNLYIFANNNRVDRMPPGGSASTLIANVSGVSGIGVAPDGSMHLAISTAHVVREYAADGGYRTNLAGFANLTDVEWAWGRLFVSSANPAGVYDLRPDGNPRLIQSGRADALEWDGARLYASAGTGVYRLDENGTATTVFSGAGLSAVSGIASRADGSLALA
jgi:sugar lactone lactonase YvrE